MNKKEEYKELENDRMQVANRIKYLETTRYVKEYNYLKHLLFEIEEEQIDLLSKIEFERYDKCPHIFVYTGVSYDMEHGGKIKHRGCIRCGLDESVLDKDPDTLTQEEQIMEDYILTHDISGADMDYKSTRILNGFNNVDMCDLNLARAIFNRIKEENPDIDTLTALKYLCIALENIRNIEVSEERKESRAKRLSLEPGFNRWNATDVCK